MALTKRMKNVYSTEALPVCLVFILIFVWPSQLPHIRNKKNKSLATDLLSHGWAKARSAGALTDWDTSQINKAKSVLAVIVVWRRCLQRRRPRELRMQYTNSLLSVALSEFKASCATLNRPAKICSGTHTAQTHTHTERQAQSQRDDIAVRANGLRSTYANPRQAAVQQNSNRLPQTQPLAVFIKLNANKYGNEQEKVSMAL